ncbi:hypothetical protein O181_071328 [Austropuccinia psidii MF-1]|uniref:Reverse transcriptase Ty1/copia-type domain-containing protein n=1 Tax=Austropuccinia psidii MF-1 TaxID=1389203 RepID=A0A9Q3F5D8_9BASI|nr:hypothetical protein [Austropuccinia psidii MF-1]
MEDLCEADYVLGIYLCRDRVQKTISLSQKLYVSKLLHKYGMSGRKSVTTPMVPSSHLTQVEEGFEVTDFNYRKAVGLLTYLTSCSQPDIAYVNSALSQFLEKLPVKRVTNLNRVLCYLQGTQYYLLNLGENGKIEYIKG